MTWKKHCKPQPFKVVDDSIITKLLATAVDTKKKDYFRKHFRLRVPPKCFDFLTYKVILT